MADDQTISLRMRFTSKIDALITSSRKTQKQIAEELGYSNPNIITMFKNGTTRVPLDKVVMLARTLDCDPAELLREWFAAHMPGVLEEIEPFMGMALTAREQAWVRGLRRAFNTVPPFKPEWGPKIRALAEGRKAR
jgi:predicted XRE-type DNA-binding protein